MKKIKLGRTRFIEIALTKDERELLRKKREKEERERQQREARLKKEEAAAKARAEKLKQIEKDKQAKALLAQQAAEQRAERERQQKELKEQRQKELEEKKRSAKEELEARKKAKEEQAQIDKAKRLELAKKREAERAKAKQNKKEIKKNKPPMRLSFKALRQDIEQYGFEFSMKKVLVQIGVVLLMVFAGTFYYQLNVVTTLAVLLVVLLFSTLIVKFNYQFRYHIEIFNEASAYMENLIYAFLKKPKIREALLDTAMSVTDTRIEKKIIEAIDFIDNSTSTNLYEDAFAIIEEEFGCPKMKQIHAYLIKVEEEGGEYEESLFVLLENLQEWIRITNNYQAEKQKIKTNMILSIGLAGGLAGIINTRLPEQFSIAGYTIYQVTSAIFLILLFLSYLLIQWKLTGSLIKEKGERKEKQIIKDYIALKNFDIKKERRNAIIISIAFVIIGILVGIFTKSLIYGGLIVFGAVYNLGSPSRKKKHIKQRLEKDIRKAFPSYLMGLALSLQTETVQTAIEKSLDDAPVILKPAIKQLITELNENPSSYEPYDKFLSDFNVPEVKSGIKTFYAINNLADDEATKQINSLIHRNNQANIKTEELKVEDEVKTTSFMILIPMVLTIPFMLVSLGLLFYNFLHLMGSVKPDVKALGA